MEISYSLENMAKPVAMLLGLLKGPRVLAFHGEMGAGKTTLIRELCAGLGSSDAASSPTFSLVNQYSLPEGRSIFHIDCYRLKSAEEAVHAGLADCFDSGQYCFVEWPEPVDGLLPDDTVHCFITTLSDNERKLRINL